MTDERTRDLEVLLTEAEDAHGLYETAELNGVYDEAWPRWYAAYLVEHGIGRLIGREIDVDRLATLLTTSWQESQASGSSHEPWATATARRIVAQG